MTNIVLDLEWNQPTVPKKRVRGLHGEIIQIGAAKVDENADVLDTFSIIIKPRFYTKMNNDISKLTLITNDDLESGVPFEDAIKQLKVWCGEDFRFITWSATDIHMLLNNLDVFGLDTSWIPPTFDAQLMFDDIEMCEDRSWALNYALYHYNEKPCGAHNALSDVLSTALVLKHFDLKEALSDEYYRYDDMVCLPAGATA